MNNLLDEIPESGKKIKTSTMNKETLKNYIIEPDMVINSIKDLSISYLQGKYVQ